MSFCQRCGANTTTGAVAGTGVFEAASTNARIAGVSSPRGADALPSWIVPSPWPLLGRTVDKHRLGRNPRSAHNSSTERSADEAPQAANGSP